MNEAPDYVYQNWIKDAFEGSKKEEKKMISVLESMDDKLARIIELLAKQGRTSPS